MHNLIKVRFLFMLALLWEAPIIKVKVTEILNSVFGVSTCGEPLIEKIQSDFGHLN